MYRSITSTKSQQEIKDTMEEVKYGCLYLLVEVCIKVVNHLLMTHEEDNRLLYIWLLYYVNNFADSRMEVPRYQSSPAS